MKNHLKEGDGRSKNNYKKNIFGVGFTGTGKYNSSKDKIAYDIWRGIIRRCYSDEKRKNEIMYLDCYVCEEWHSFQVFADWFYENQIIGFDIDKDLLFKGNKIYSPETCCFLPRSINSLFVIQKSKRNNGIIGVTKNGNKYSSMVKIKNNPIYLGNFINQELAFLAYKKAKEDNIKNIANEFKPFITEKVFNAMINYKVEITD